MDMMRKLMMGAAPIGRTLVNTTTATKNAPITPPMDFKVGASYSVSWTGTIPSSNYVTLFLITGGDDLSKGRCEAAIMYGGLFCAFLGSSLPIIIRAIPGRSIALELRFKVNTVSTSSPYYTMDVEVYINGTKEYSKTCDVTTNTIDSFRYYENVAGTFIIKKLS